MAVKWHSFEVYKSRKRQAQAGTLALLAVSTCALLTTNALPAMSQSSAKDLFMVADSADTHEKYEQAIKLYENLIKQLNATDPSNAKIERAKVRAARIYLTTGQYDKATPYFKELSTKVINVDKDPEIMVDLDDLSNAYLKYKDDPSRNMEALQRCLAVRQIINPRHPYLVESYRLLSNCCTSHKQYDQAIAWIRKAIDIDKQMSPTKRSYLAADTKTLAAIYVEKKAYKEALDAAGESLKVCEQFQCALWLEGELHLLMGQVLTSMQKYPDAEKEFKLAITTATKTHGKGNLVNIIAKDSLKKLDEIRKKNPHSR